MADNVEIQGLEFQIVNDSTQAVAGLQNLINTLNRLKTATNGGATGLSKTAQGIRELSNSLKGLNSGDASQKITRLANALTTLSRVGNVKISSSIANQLTAINTALAGLKWTDGDKLTSLANGLRPLSELGKANMTTFINQLSKLPKVIEDLKTADIDKFTQQMKDLAAAMKPFADEMQKVSNGFSAFPSKIQKLITSTEKYNASASKATSTTGKFTGGLKALNVAAAAVAFRKIGQFIAQTVTESNKYQEDLNLFTVALGQYAGEAQNYAEKVSEVLGIDPAQWLRNQGVFNTLLTGFGDTAERAQLMSRNLTQLGYDLSSFFNIPIEDAMQKLQSGISGELEPLRRLGYDLSQAQLEQTALNLGIKESVANMTQAEKAELRYYAVMTQVTTAQGDMARTLQAPANQLRILQAQITQASRAIGNIFIPALNAILPYAIAVVKAIREIANALANLLGFTLTKVDYSSVGKLASGTGAVADNLGSAAGSAKELKKYIAGFDELNVLPSNSSGGSGGGASGGGGGGFDFDLPTYDFLGDAVETRVDEIKDKLKPLLVIALAIGAAFAGWKIGKKVTTAVAALKEGFAVFASSGAGQAILSKLASCVAGVALQFNAAGGGVKGFLSVLGLVTKVAAPAVAILVVVIATLKVLIERWNDIKSAVANTFGKLKVGERLQALNDKLNQLGEKLGWVDGFWNGLKSTIGSLMNFIGEVVITVVGSSLIGLFNGLVGVLDGVVTAMTGVVEIFTGFAQFLKGVFTGDLELVKKSFATFGSGISKIFSGVIDGLVNGFTGWVSGVIEGVTNLGGTLLGTLIPNIVNGVATFFSNLCTDIAQFFTNAWNSICTLWSTVGNWFNTKVITPVDTFFSTLGTKIAASFTTSWAKVKTEWGVVTDWFKSKIIAPVQTAFESMCSSVGGFFVSLWDKIAGVFAGVGGWFQSNVVDAINSAFRALVNGAISLLERMLNGIIRTLNNFIGKINSVLSIVGGGISTISYVSIPRLANGGFVDEGQLFIAREAGAEMVGRIGGKTAVANNDQIVESVSQGVYEAVQRASGETNSSNSRPITVIVQMNGKELFRQMVDENNAAIRATGFSPLLA